MLGVVPRQDPLSAPAPSGHLRVAGGVGSNEGTPKPKPKPKPRAVPNAPPKAKSAVQEATIVSSQHL